MGIKRLLVCAGVFCAFVLGAGNADAFVTAQTQNQTSIGQDFTFTFSNLPIALGNVTVIVGLYGDYNATNEYADVLIDGAGQVQAQGSATECNTVTTNSTYTVAAGAVNNNQQLVVNVNLSAAVDVCGPAFSPRVRVSLHYPSRPDLSNFATVAPYTGSTAGDGSLFTVRGGIQNLYENLSTNFYIRYYYCPTAAFSAAACVLLTQSYITDDFTPSQIRFYTSPTLALPPQAEVGTRYILFRVDSADQVTEASETNNDTFDAISVTTQPDLDITASTVPFTGSTNTPGAQFTAQYTVSNDDNTSAVFTNFVMSYAYCPVYGLNAGCTVLATQTISQNIVSGGTHVFTTPTLTIPASATTGTHGIRATVDSTGVIPESDETNNVDWDSIYVGAGALPDLTADQLTVPVTGSVASAGATFTMTSRINNSAAVAQNTDFQVNYYYCPAATTAGCTALGSQTVTTNLAANGNTIVTSPTLTMPTAALYGAGQIRAFVDATSLVPEANEANNNTWKAITVTAKPDLTIATVSVPFTGDTNGPGSQFTGRFTIQNAASTSALTTDFEVQFFYCPNNNPTGCVSLGSNSITNNFLSGASYTFTSGQLTLPATASPGTHYIRAFVDSKSPQDVDEGNETNNNVYAPITLTTGAADLHVKTFTATAVGTTVTYSVETCNQGGATATAILVGLFYNRATAPTCADTADDSYTIAAGLGAGLCNTHVFTRVGAPAGATTPYAMGDQGCAVTEGDETNNTKSASVTVTLPPDQGKVDTGVELDFAIKIDAIITKPEATVADLAIPPDQAPVADTGTPTADITGPTVDGKPATDSTTPVTDGIPSTDGTPAVDKGTTSKVDTGAGQPPTSDDGCSCTLQGRGDSAFSILGLMLGLALLAFRRRRR